MGVVRSAGAALVVVGFTLGSVLLLAGVAGANPDEDSSGGSGCPPGGCVNIYEPPDSSTSGSSGSGSSSSGHSTSGDSGSSGSSGSSGDGHDDDTKTKKPEKSHQPRTEDYPAPVQVPPRVPARRSAPPAAPGADFVPAVPAVAPVLEQDAVSRGSGAVLTGDAADPGAGEDVPAGSAPGGEVQADPELVAEASPTGDTPWLLVGGMAALVAVGAGLAFAPSRKDPGA